MALSQKAWVAAGLVARLLMIAVLAMSVQLRYSNHTRFDYSDRHNYQQLQSYTYAVAAALIGLAASALQVPASVYLLCKSKRTTPSLLVLDATMYADVVVTALLASGVGAGFGATNDALQFIKYGVDWNKTENADQLRDDLTAFLHRGSVAIVFLLIGMLLSLLATVVSTRLRARATDDLADD
ncbi:hypothetical protein QOZ80_2AG0134610 [Eleusine coracana subsp. coracana]|nr:hypothetical protein QOZ80_2AG0134610 [Eleusine coracana subsp. coracana]